MDPGRIRIRYPHPKSDLVQPTKSRPKTHVGPIASLQPEPTSYEPRPKPWCKQPFGLRGLDGTVASRRPSDEFFDSFSRELSSSFPVTFPTCFLAAPWLAIFSPFSTVLTLPNLFLSPIKVIEVVLESYFTLLVGLLIKM